MGAVFKATQLTLKKRVAIKVATRNIPTYRDPAVILIDQLKEVYIDGELDTIETATGMPR